MKNYRNDIKGITLISLVITIIVLLILASVATYSGLSVIRSAKLEAFTTEMKIMQTQVNELYEKSKNDDGIINLGKDLSSVSSQANKVFTENESGITDKEGYRYFDKETIKDLNIDGVEGEFFVNISKRSVVSYYGFEYEGKNYYTLEQLPNGLYNVDYIENSEKPTFEVNTERYNEDKWKIVVGNIQYNGYIDKWQVKYKLISQDTWNTSEDTTFFVGKPGKYEIKIQNGEIESEVKSIEKVRVNRT